MPTNEAMRICGLTANAEGHHGGDPDCVCGDIDRLVAAAVKAERERLIPLVCDLCDEPGVGIPVRLDDLKDLDDLEEPDWWHNADERLCLASPIHEALREKEERDAD